MLDLNQTPELPAAIVPISTPGTSTDPWDSLCEPYPTIRTAEHERILAKIRELGGVCIWDEAHQCWQTHTAVLKQVHAALGLAATFDTVSPGKRPTEANCYLFYRPNGAFLVKRFGTPKEASCWTPDDNGHPTCAFNAKPPDPPKRSKIEILTSKQLASGDYKLRYLIDNIWVEGQPGGIGGPKKGLKTTFAIAAAISLATGLPFLGRFAIDHICRVLMLSGESGLATIQETARRIAKAMGVELADIDNLFWSVWLPILNSDNDLQTLEKVIEEVGCEALFLDPIYLMMRGIDAGNLFQQGALLRRLSLVCEKHKVTPILLHHLRKRGKGDNSYDPPELDDFAWAGFAEFFRQWVLLGRREAYVAGTGEHRLWMQIGGSAGHGGLWAMDVNEGPAGDPRIWEVELSTPDEARAEKKADSIRSRLIVAALNFPAGETKSVLFDVAKLRNDGPARFVFDALVADGSFVPQVVEKGGKKFDGWRLSDSLLAELMKGRAP